jgi:hypothetical protein
MSDNNSIYEKKYYKYKNKYIALRESMDEMNGGGRTTFRILNNGFNNKNSESHYISVYEARKVLEYLNGIQNAESISSDYWYFKSQFNKWGLKKPEDILLTDEAYTLEFDILKYLELIDEINGTEKRQWNVNLYYGMKAGIYGDDLKFKLPKLVPKV